MQLIGTLVSPSYVSFLKYIPPGIRSIPILCVLFIAGHLNAAAQEPVQPPSDKKIEDVFIARDDGNGKAGEIVKGFKTTDIPIYCVVMLSAADPVNVKMNLVAVKVGGVRAETKVVTAGYTTKQGQNRVNFTGRPEGQWVPGIYRIDVFVAGKLEQSITFEMHKPVDVPIVANTFDTLKPKKKN